MVAKGQSLMASKLLRLAGQSLRVKAERQFDDFVPYLMIVFAFWIVCLVEWVQKIAGEHPTPGFWIFLSLLVTCYGGVPAFPLYSPLPNAPLRQRREPPGAEIFHPIP